MLQVRPVGLFAFLSIGACIALAQSPTAQMSGRVTDASGAIVIGARVTAKSVDTGIARDTVSNETGNYTIPLLNPGNYELSASKEGFRPINRTGITLNVDQAARFDFTMEVGSVTETVQISGQAPLVDSERSSLGSVVGNRDIVNLPLNGRATTGLAFLVAGVVPGPATNGDSGRSPANLWINGGRGNSSDILADGLSITVPEFNPSLTLPLLPQVDVIQEFKVHTNSLSAEFGRTGGGIVDYVYKSGTNQFHGTLFEFARDNILNANGFFNNLRGVEQGGRHQDQFGGTIGGPVLIPHLVNGRDKFFFFVSYEGVNSRTSSTSASTSLTFPTVAERTGDFSKTFRVSGGACQAVRIFDPLSTTPAPGGGFTRTQFPNNVIPKSSIDPVAAKIATFYPLPNAPGDACTGAVNFIGAGGVSVSTTHLPSVRVDYYATSKDRLNVRVNTRRAGGQGIDTYGTLGRPSSGRQGINTGDVAALSYTRTLNSTLLAEFRFGLARYRSISAGTAAGANEAGDDFNMRASLGWTGAAGNFIDQMNKPLAFPQINVSGYSTLGTGQQAFNDGGGTSYQWAGTVTEIHGAHTIKVGTDYRVLQESGPNAFFASGAYTFAANFTQGPNPTSAGATVGNTMASLLMGLGTGQAQINPRLLVSNHYFALFVQDDIRLTKKLVLNLGLRYDLEDGRSERFKQLSYFDFTAPSPLAKLVPSLPNIHGGLKFIGVDGNPSKQFNTDKNNFGPRAGFAYSFDPKTVARVGYGILYEPFIGRAASSGAGYTGFGTITTWVSSLDGVNPYHRLADPFPGGLTPSPGSSQGLLTQTGDALGSDGSNGRDGAFDRTSVVGYIQQWNVSVQRALPADISIQLAYAGNKATKLADGGGFQENQLNPSYMTLGNQLLQSVPNPFFGIITTGPLAAATTTRGQLLRAYPQFTNLLNFRPSAASSVYHSFQGQITKRFSHGVQFVVAYTLGKAIDDSSNAVDFRGDLGGSGRHQDYYNRRADRSISLNDIHERLVLSYVVDLPFGRGRKLGANWNRLTNGVLGGWQFNGITTFQSGQPLIIENATNNTGIFSDKQRPNINGNPVLASDRSTQDKLAKWFDPSVFSQPAAFTFGNTPRVMSNLRGDGQKNFDLSLFKNFAVRERGQIQFRSEFFNAFNTPQFSLPGTSFGASGFGVVSSQLNSSRQIQFAIKFLF